MKAGWVAGVVWCVAFACAPAYAHEQGTCTGLGKWSERRCVLRLGAGGGERYVPNADSADAPDLGGEAGGVVAELGWRQPLWVWRSEQGAGALVVEPIARLSTLAGDLNHHVGLIGEAGSGLSYDIGWGSAGFYAGYALGSEGHGLAAGFGMGMLSDLFVMRMTTYQGEETPRMVVSMLVDVVMLQHFWSDWEKNRDHYIEVSKPPKPQPVGRPPERR